MRRAAALALVLLATPAWADRLGANMDVFVTWGGDQPFADVARGGGWLDPGGSPVVLGTDGWPTAGGMELAILLDSTPTGAIAGDYASRCTGSTTVTASGSGVTILGVSYDAPTNTTTWTTRLVEGANAVVRFGSAVKDVRIMRPGLSLDVDTAATRWNPAWIADLTYGSIVRTQPMAGPGLGTSGTVFAGTNGNYNVHWSTAEAVTAGVPLWQATHAYVLGDVVRTTGGMVYRARVAGTSGSSEPSGEGNWTGGAGVTDGTVHWIRATRKRPTESAYLFHGASWEDLILLANRLAPGGVWINLPYFASDRYLTLMARTFKCGSDGDSPWTSGDTNTCAGGTPTYPALAANAIVYFEPANELWNDNYFLTAEVRATVSAQTGSTDPHEIRYGGAPAWPDLYRDDMYQIIRASLIFRSVVGDSAMMTQYRPVHAGQLDYGIGDGATSNWAAIRWALDYVSGAWGASSTLDTINGITNPKQAVSYYIWCIAPAPYLQIEPCTTASTVDALYTCLNDVLNTRKPQINYWKHYAHANGVKYCAYETGTETPSGGAWGGNLAAAWADARQRTLMKDLVDYQWLDTPPGGYTFDANTADLIIPTNTISDTTFGMLTAIDAAHTSQRWLAMEDLAAELGGATVTSIAVTPATASKYVGQTQQFTCTATWSSGPDTDCTSAAGVVWTSTDPVVASIGSATGLASALSAGSTTIQAAYEGQTDTAALDVSAAPVESSQRFNAGIGWRLHQ